MALELVNNPLSLADYQALVEVTHRDDEAGRDWRQATASLIHAEWSEAMTQHGPGQLLLMPPVYDAADMLCDYPDLKEGLAHEVGDLKWFGFHIVNRLGGSAAEICSRSLEKHAGQPVGGIESLDELQAAVIANAGTIKVLTKKALQKATIDYTEQDYEALADNPGYLLTRVTARLVRALTGRAELISPPSASDLEPLTRVEDAVGDYLNVLVYIAKARLDWEAGGLAMATIQRLLERDVWGKAGLIVPLESINSPVS